MRNKLNLTAGLGECEAVASVGDKTVNVNTELGRHRLLILYD